MPENTKIDKRNAGSAVFLLAAPLLLFIMGFCLRGIGGTRIYSVAAVMVLLCAVGAFFLRFDRRRPRARELVTVAVLSALAAASRVAFFMTPLDMKPLMAVVIIAGACLGMETGFLTGALSMLVSNFFFGQGPFTPWQMFAAGAVGCFAGMLFRRVKIGKTRGWLCVYGAASVLLIYGPVVDFSTLLFTAPELTWTAAMAVFAAGLPFNAGHAGATALFLFFLALPMGEKLARLRKKYGLME